MGQQGGGLTARLIERLASSDTLTKLEIDALAACCTDPCAVPARAVLVPAREPCDESKLLLDGFVARQRELPDGRRQILAIHVPGDFIDLHGFVLRSLDHAVVALTPVKVATAAHACLRDLIVAQPHVGRLLWFLTAVDAAIHREWIASFGRSAAGRVAHLLCELRLRLAVVGLAGTDGYALPLTQIDIADATSLTPVHVNRTLRQLREAGVVDFRVGRVEIRDLAALERVAGFDPAYLYLDRVAR